MFSDSEHFDPFRLSVELGRIDERIRAARLSGRERGADPFSFREFPGKSTLEAVQELPDYDPLRPALIRYIVRLTDERIHQPWQDEDRRLQGTKHPVREPVEDALNLVEIRSAALGADANLADSWWRSYQRAERALSEHRILRFERRRQVHERLGVSEPFSFWDPVTPGEDQPTLPELAGRFLRATNDAAETQWGQGWGAIVRAALGTKSPEGWPARLAPDTLRELFSAPELFRGISVEPGRLPARLAPASFSRAGARIGRSLARVLRSRDVPHVIAHDAYDLGEFEMAELVIAWSLCSAFRQRRLGLSRREVLESRRHYASARLAHARLAALRLLMMHAASRGRAALREEFGGISVQGLGMELDASAPLARLDARLDEPLRFSACLSAAAKEFELIQEYDEDWWDNPRAQEQIRAELSGPRANVVRSSRLVLGEKCLKERVFSEI